MKLSELSILISFGVLLAAVISPIAVAIINNAHQTKIKKMEIVSDHKLKAIESYLQCVEQCRKNQFGSTIKDYAVAYGHAIIYVSEGSRELMYDIDIYINSDALKSPENLGINIPKDKIDALCKSLSSDLKVNKYTL